MNTLKNLQGFVEGLNDLSRKHGIVITTEDGYDKPLLYETRTDVTKDHKIAYVLEEFEPVEGEEPPLLLAQIGHVYLKITHAS